MTNPRPALFPPAVMNNLSRLLLLAVGLACITPASLRAQSLGPVDGHHLAATDTGRVRPGMLAPDFALESFAGPRVQLSQFRGKKVVLLAFYRGHW